MIKWIVIGVVIFVVLVIVTKGKIIEVILDGLSEL